MKESDKDPRRGLPSASSIERYSHCPRSYLLEKNVPESERFKNEDAEIGTRIHLANETGDLSVLESLSEEDLVVRIREREEELYQKWVDDYSVRDAEIKREERVWLVQNGVKICSAKIDFYAISQQKRICLCIDAKSGRNAVTPPVRNLQLRTGIVILAANYALVGARAAIVQPFTKSQAVCEYSPDDIYNKGGAWDQLISILDSANKPDAKAVAGDWCTHCAAKAICPTAQAVVTDLAALTGVKWATLTPATKLELWDRAKLAQKIAASIEQNCKAELSADPNSIPGLTKKPDTSMRTISSAIGAYQTLQAEFPNLKPDELNAKFDEFCEFSIGPVEEFYRNIHGGTAKAAQAWFNSKMKDYIKQVPRAGRVERVKE